MKIQPHADDRHVISRYRHRLSYLAQNPKGMSHLNVTSTHVVHGRLVACGQVAVYGELRGSITSSPSRRSLDLRRSHRWSRATGATQTSSTLESRIVLAPADAALVFRPTKAFKIFICHHSTIPETDTDIASSEMTALTPRDPSNLRAPDASRPS